MPVQDEMAELVGRVETRPTPIAVAQSENHDRPVHTWPRERIDLSG